MCVGETTDGPPNLLYTIKEEGWSAEQGRAYKQRQQNKPSTGTKATGNAKYTQSRWEKRRLSSVRKEVR